MKLKSATILSALSLTILLLGLSPVIGQPRLQATQPITIGNAARVKQIALLEGHKQPVFGLAFSPDSKTLASGGIDKTVRLWDALTGKQIALLEGHTKQAIAVGFSADGSTLISAGYDETVRVWDVKTGKQTAQQSANPADASQMLQISTVFDVFNLNSTTLAYVTDAASSIYLWDVKTSSQRSLDVPKPGQQMFGRVAFTADGKWLAAQLYEDQKASIQLWDVTAGKPTTTIAAPDNAFVNGEGFAISPDGTTIAAVDSNTSEIQVFDVKTGTGATLLKGHLHDDSGLLLIEGLAFSPDGSMLASVSYDKTIRLWDVKAGKELVSLPSHAQGAAEVVFSPDGMLFATADLDGTVQVWGVPAG